MQYIIKKQEATVVTEENSMFREYRFSQETFSMGVSTINGRYPRTGYEVDEEVDAKWYVAQGKGTVWIHEEEYVVEQGDIISLPKGEKYWIQGENLVLVVGGSPVWYESQHKHVGE